MSNPAQRANKLFVQTFGTLADTLYFAPGRVNLIGEHTDYNDGFVLPAAINFHTIIAIKRREDSQFRAVSDAFPGEMKEWTFGEEGNKPESPEWADYLKGFSSAMAISGLATKGMDLAIVSNVPLGAGLSSSAALEIAFGTAINDVNQIQLSPLAIAQLAQRGENHYVGCACGIMDQMISALGQQDHALLIDCLDLDSEAVSIPENLSLIIINSNVKRGLVESEYNLRREQCEQVAEHFQLDSLRHLELADLEAAKDQLSDVHYRRAKHVITENRRTQNAAWALESGNISQLSTLMAESHISMRDDFEITVPEIDFLVEIVSSVIAERGGVRMTGGGFGGCVVALVDHELTDAVVEIVEQQYLEKTGIEATIYLCSASDGAKRLDN
ncbi:galactokinase [Shewanella sp. Choline-02u-19]|uniref:galactokinase n=1 Tax=unclassified Shewanella TaxID=196818 RepID=UPI000C34C497|nr:MULTISPECIES: galactokinase [unclassified Shewanella]PKG55261.1 galactokinase [Shewanella sp. GutDb-MelDb]PKG73603.1 galactokinase [Shewanella sp. GutCb]PKH55630.1 galactokinase [Shewanella sp. Bg11-22]PKI29896.1 galactokinase [Shewanella sp. Choline-02u-19]